MNTAPEKAPGPIKPLILAEMHFTAQELKAVVRSGLEAGCDVLVMIGTDESLPGELVDIPGIHRHPPVSGAGRGDAVREAAAAAGRMGMTHLITLDPEVCCETALAGVVAGIRTEPQAIVSGVRPNQTGGERERPPPGRSLANFWFRVQTGIRSTDSTGGLRAYPLNVLEHIKPWTGGAAFDYEILVRAAWAGADIREVAATTAPRPRGGRGQVAGRAVEPLIFFGLNVHLTMRSITPWPHRKLARQGNAAGAQVVSLRRPWRSLKILVGQNISARRLGLAAALGVFVGTLPLIACHSIAVLFSAGFFRLSKVAALSASQLCMPPIVPALCIEAGYYVRHGAFLTEISLRTLGYEALDRLLEWLVGSLILAPILAAAVGGSVYLMARHIEGRIGSDGTAGTEDRH